MKKTLLSIFYFLISFQAFSQNDDDSTQSYRREVLVPNFTVKFVPLRALEFYNTFQAAVEYRLGYQMALQHEIGYGNAGTRVWLFGGDEREASTNFRIASTFKIYTRSKLQDTYIGLDIGYKNSYFELEGADGKIEIIKNSMTYRLVVGKQMIHNKYLVIDAFAGIGIKQISVRNKNDSTFFEADEGAFVTDHTQPGNYLTPALALGVKVGFMFYKK